MVETLNSSLWRGKRRGRRRKNSKRNETSARYLCWRPWMIERCSRLRAHLNSSATTTATATTTTMIVDDNSAVGAIKLGSIGFFLCVFVV